VTTHDAIIAIVDGGVMADIGAPELRVLLAYLARADATGEAWPSTARIAKAVKLPAANVRRVRRELCRRRLLDCLPERTVSIDGKPTTIRPYRVTLGGRATTDLAGQGGPGGRAATDLALGPPRPPEPVTRTSQGTKRGRAAAPAVPPMPELPASLDTPRMREAWSEWYGHITELAKRKKYPLTERALRGHLKTCEELGPDAAVAAIKRSVDGVYRAIFPPNGNHHDQRHRKPHRADAAAREFPQPDDDIPIG
jgi:hypothetical protein